MSLGRTTAIGLLGLQTVPVDVEADISTRGLPALNLVGSLDKALQEARDRVRAASANAGLPVPDHRVTVSLTPASLPKQGSGFDLAIAVAVLAAAREIDPVSAAETVHIGELGLDGRLRPVPGVLPAVLAAVRMGLRRVVVPAANADEAALVPGARVVGAVSLRDVVRAHGGRVDDDDADPPEAVPFTRSALAAPPSAPLRDLRDVAGQDEARRALEVAAAGAHHLLMMGPPGAGKTMLASRLSGLLPDLDDDEAVEVTAVHSVLGTFDPAKGLIRRPPYEDPHHTASTAAVIGGGQGVPRPGSATRAHRGVLFLDEALEFARPVLDALRQPLEEGRLVIARRQMSACFPARFQLVMAANPCPCGRAVGKATDCTCTPQSQRLYAARLSGPIRDRIDLQIEVLPISRGQMTGPDAPLRESSATVAARVAVARAVQADRWAADGWKTNSEVPGPALRRAWRLTPATTTDLDRALDRGLVTVRGYDRILRVAWTLSDLDGTVRPHRDHLGEALLMRHVGRVAA